MFRLFLGSLCCFSHLYVDPYAIVFIYTAILTTVPYLDYCSFISLEIRLYKPLCSLFSVVLTILDSFHFHKACQFLERKTDCQNLIASALNLQLSWGLTDISTVLNFPTLQCGISLHLFRCLLSEFYSFPPMNFVFILLDLCLSITFFGC